MPASSQYRPTTDGGMPIHFVGILTLSERFLVLPV